MLFSNAGTLAKFDRIGVLAGYAAKDHSYLRAGYRFNPDPDSVTPVSFVDEVIEGQSYEGWADELQVFHNPNATIPLPSRCFDGLAQHFFENEQLRTTYSQEAVLSSITMVLHAVDDETFEQAKPQPS